jgi:hypothetical protein
LRHQIGVSKYNQRGNRVLHFPPSIIREMQFLELKIYKISSDYKFFFLILNILNQYVSIYRSPDDNGSS